jgi:heptaprenyl diphosphate synthase
VSPGLLFAAGALLLPAFLFQQDPGVRALQVLLFLGLNALSGRRVRIVQILVVTVGVVAFNLLIPTGRVLLTVLGLPVTETALRSGVLKATAVVGMIAISQFALRGDLRIPGRIGGLIAASLGYFERVLSMRARIDRKNLIGSIDDILFAVQSPAAPPAAGAGHAGSGHPASRTSPAAAAMLALVVASQWAVLAWTLVRPHPLW